ncbi:hypothetical protein TNCV_4971451 [Trichonephila clavipes]|nr:hypothetical protein TNCV_4971451 [Trichonephila clavipes]
MTRTTPELAPHSVLTSIPRQHLKCHQDSNSRLDNAGHESMTSYMRAFGDRPRNFEPLSNDEDDNSAGTPFS